MPRPHKRDSPFRHFNSLSEIIRLAVMIYVRFTLSLRNVEDPLFERIDLCNEIMPRRICRADGRLGSLPFFAIVTLLVT